MFALTGQRKLGKKATHRKLMVKNQMRSLFISGHVTTTTSKAKVLKANAESLITSFVGKTKELTNVRLFEEYFGGAELAKHVSEYIESKKGTVTIVKIGFRAGDNAEQSKIVLNNYKTLDGVKSEAKKAKVKSSKKKSDKKDDKKSTPPESDKGVPPVEGKKGGKDNLAKRMASKFSGSKERSKARSGLSG